VKREKESFAEDGWGMEMRVMGRMANGYKGISNQLSSHRISR